VGLDEKLSVRAADVFDVNVMVRIAGVKGQEFDWWGISVFDEMVDEPFIGDDCCQLGKAVQTFADFGRQRERVEFSLENV
jgi:hypothetical protein